MYRYTTSWGAVCPVKTYTVGLVCKKKRAFPSARKNLAQDESSNTTEHQQKMCTLDNLEVIISVVVKKTLYKSDLPALVVCSRNLQIFQRGLYDI